MAGGRVTEFPVRWRSIPASFCIQPASKSATDARIKKVHAVEVAINGVFAGRRLLAWRYLLWMMKTNSHETFVDGRFHRASGTQFSTLRGFPGQYSRKMLIERTQSRPASLYWVLVQTCFIAIPRTMLGEMAISRWRNQRLNQHQMTPSITSERCSGQILSFGINSAELRTEQCVFPGNDNSISFVNIFLSLISRDLRSRDFSWR